MKTVQNKHIVVIGAARSGVPVASLLNRKGAGVFVTDNGTIDPDMKLRLQEEEIPFEEGSHTDRAKEGDFAVLSPGVPTHAPLVQFYLKNGKAVYSEIEVASWYNDSPIVAVTGSNGKTTVANWMGHTWKTAEKSHLLGGNIGTAFSDLVNQSAPDKDMLLEISSFQLDHMDTFRPHISMLLNITPDHLDRYNNDFEQYAAAKFRIFENQTEDDWLIYNYDDPVIKQRVESLVSQQSQPKPLAFSLSNELDQGAFVRNEEIVVRIHNTEEVLMPVEELSLRGMHNLNNGLATALAARASEIKNDLIRESLKTFEGVEHRLELVRELDGVKYINDSKATNINAVWYALDSISEPMTLILGGRDKGNDYDGLKELLKKKVHTIVAIGEARPRISEALKGVVPNYEEVETMADAVRQAKKVAKRGEVVLLSPACSSFDMFENYEHRGEVFKTAVNNL